MTATIISFRDPTVDFLIIINHVRNNNIDAVCAFLNNHEAFLHNTGREGAGIWYMLQSVVDGVEEPTPDMIRAIYRSFDRWYESDVTNHWAPVIRETPRTNQQVRDNLANIIVRNTSIVIHQIEVGI